MARHREREELTVRLALTNDGMPSKEYRYSKIFKKEELRVRLAHTPGAQGDNCLLGKNDVEKLPETLKPALLVSYVYLEGFLANQERYQYRDWMMDSGAFTAYNAGTAIDLNKYIEACLSLKEKDKTLTEIICLDVIGSGPDSLKNAFIMKEAGVDCMPVFHIGDDWQILKEYCDNFEKVGLSCRFGEPMKKSYWFYDQCFARQWPHKFHSFGWVGEEMLMKYPFISSDSSTWELRPCAFGSWKFFGRIPVRGSKQNLTSQVRWFLELEDRLRQRWKKEIDILNAKAEEYAVRFVVGTGRSIKDTGINALDLRKDKKNG